MQGTDAPSPTSRLAPGRHAPGSGASRSRGIGGLFRGGFAALRGMRMAIGNRDVHKVYFRFTLALLVASVILGGLLGYGVWVLTEPEAGGFLARHGLDFLASGGLWILRVVGLLIAAVAAPILAVILLGLLFPVFAEAVFFAGLRALDRPRAEALQARPGLPIHAAVWKSVRILLHFLVLTVIALALGLVPLVGVVLGPAVQLWAAGKILGWELMDPYFDKQRMGYGAQKVYVRERATGFVGFGLPWSFVLALPVVGPLLFGLAQAAAPALLVDVLEPGASPDAPR